MEINLSNLRRIVGQWLKSKIYPLTEDKIQNAYNYYLSLPNNRGGGREPYRDVDYHQLLLYVARYYLNTHPHNFTSDISRSLLSTVISDLHRSTSDNEKYKAVIYCRRFNDFIAEANLANQNYFNQHDIDAEGVGNSEDNTTDQDPDEDHREEIDQSFLLHGSSRGV